MLKAFTSTSPEPAICDGKIQLHPELILGKGSTRICYFHPLDAGKCLKIDNCALGGPTAKEARYYGKLARIRPDLGYAHIPRFYGWTETNLGPGGIFDLIRDETTGEVSKSLDHFISAGEVTADHPLWRQAHQNYLEMLFDDAVVIRDFNPGNLCVRKMRDGSYRFVTIDGIGHSDFLPVCDYFRWAARRKIARQVARKNFGSLEEILARAARRKLAFPASRSGL
jgi:PhoP regulatory network protein YrbL